AGAPADDPEAFQSTLMPALFHGMTRVGAVDSYTAVLPVAEGFRPDLILRDGMDLGACLVAERLGVPQLPTPSGTTNILNPAKILGPLNATREAVGLPVRNDPLSLLPHGRIDYVPPALSFARYLGPSSLAYRQTVDVARAAALPAWVAELATDRPLVFAALGTALPMARDQVYSPTPPALFPNARKTLRTMAEAVARLDDCVVVLATAGVGPVPDDLPPHVHVVEQVPQPLLLEAVDVFLTHGGFNSVRESLRTATPMVVLPQFADQYPNARRVEELGLGRRVTTRTPDGVAADCRAVLADSGIAARVRRARLAMLTLPPVESAVGDLVKLVTG
ncbi:glycosyltransferase, partial [Streptomyces sp. 8K308]|uniref:glycosyltransferase n=1 Tax=Streptomyces sp. 8K308 TaxID=2530388 RepID=UPI0010525CBA